jgi:serine/threonine protein kinase
MSFEGHNNGSASNGHIVAALNGDANNGFLEAGQKDPHDRTTQEPKVVPSPERTVAFNEEMTIAEPTISMEMAKQELMANLPPDYEYVSTLGSGGMAYVFLVRDGSGQSFVVKVLKERDNKHGWVGSFVQEARDIDGLSGRGHTPPAGKDRRINDQGDSPKALYYYSMEYEHGIDLLQLIKTAARRKEEDKSFKGLPAQMVMLMCLECAKNIAAIQSDLDCVHRDVKPGNLIVTAAGPMRVLDTGIARKVGGDNGVGSFVGRAGTKGFGDQAQFEGLAVDARADVSGLGRTFMEVMKVSDGRLPKAFTKLLTSMTQENPRLRPDFMRVIATLLQLTGEGMLRNVPDDERAKVIADDVADPEKLLDAYLAAYPTPVLANRKRTLVGIAAILGLAIVGGVAALNKSSSKGPSNSPDTAAKGSNANVQENKIEKKTFGDVEHTMVNGVVTKITLFPNDPERSVEIDRERCVFVTTKKGELVFASSFIPANNLIRILGLSSITDLPPACKYGTRIDYMPNCFFLYNLGRLAHFEKQLGENQDVRKMFPLIGPADEQAPTRGEIFAKSFEKLYKRMPGKEQDDDHVRSIALKMYEHLIEEGVDFAFGEVNFYQPEPDYVPTGLKDDKGNPTAMFVGYKAKPAKNNSNFVRSGLSVSTGLRHAEDTAQIRATEIIDLDWRFAIRNDSDKILRFVRYLCNLNPEITKLVKERSRKNSTSVRQSPAPGRDVPNAVSPGKGKNRLPRFNETLRMRRLLASSSRQPPRRYG